MTPATEQFLAAIRAAGIQPPDVIEADGKLRRFSSNGKRGDDAGWYVLHDDGVPAGAFGCWRSGVTETWRADIGRKLTPAEDAEHRAKFEEMRREREAEREREQAKARELAARMWNEAKPATDDNPYLKRKGVKAVVTLRDIPVEQAAAILGYAPKSRDVALTGRLLIAPVKIHDKLSTLELIDEAGRKSAIYRGAKDGGYWAAQTMPQGNGEGLTLLIGEGVATALSAQEASGHLVVAALSSSNLESVARAMRERYPSATLVLLADLGNGQSKASGAAQAVGGKLAIPEFGAERSDGAKDFNDLAQRRGAQAVKAAIQSAKSLNTLSELVTRNFSDIEPQPVNWLWPDRIARGKLTIIAGDPGLGKSQLTTSLAAIVTKGGSWPVDRTSAERGRVIFLSAEDDPADTIRPRLDAAGADVSRCEIIKCVQDIDRRGTKIFRTFNLKTDMIRLSALLAERGDVALVIIDPITAYCGDTDTHRNADVRAVLAEVSEVAGRHKAAFVAISHLNKGDSAKALQRVTGSLAFVAAARAAFLVAEDQSTEGQKLFVPMKNNIGPDKTGYAYRIEGVEFPRGIKTSRISWASESVTITADEALTTDTEDKSELETAMDFLKEELKNGPISSREVERDAEGNGIAERTLFRAKSALGVKSIKGGMKDGWQWKLAPKIAKNGEDGQDKTWQPSGVVGSLPQPAGPKGEAL